jgi:hypothetical protein
MRDWTSCLIAPIVEAVARATSSMLIRPHFADLLYAVDFAINKGYPARGNVVDYQEARAGLAREPILHTPLHKGTPAMGPE